MKLSRNSIFHQLYEYTYGYPAGFNFCPFFWKTLLALAFFPFTWVSYPIPMDHIYSIWDRLLYSVPFWVAGAALCAVVLLSLWYPWDVLWATGGLTGAIILLLLLIAGGCLFAEWFREKDESPIKVAVFQAVRDTVTIVSTKKESFTDKYCPKIDWD